MNVVLIAGGVTTHTPSVYMMNIDCSLSTNLTRHKVLLTKTKILKVNFYVVLHLDT
jgi:hypothetical protein